jgi:hypothetical protein
MSSQSEPALITDPALDRVLHELSSREPIFHRPQPGMDRAFFESMTAPDFWEIGASGRKYSRSFVLDTVVKRYENDANPDVWQTSDFYCRMLAPDLYQITYTLLQDKVRTTRRSSIWRHSASGWQVVFHQGTIVER